ncbi:MAG: hypothetical protein IJP09_02625 [Clostridia bacterium]|nr:hypothetical protein [Clostridia bacterium]
MKKIIATLLLAVMILSTACASAPELLPFIDEKPTGTGLAGQTLKVHLNFGTYKDDSPYRDALIEHVENIATKLNGNIELRYDREDSTEREIDVPFEIAAGTYQYDVYVAGADTNIVKSKIFLPITEFYDYIDYRDSEKYGTLEYLEGIMYDGVLYGVSPQQWPGIDAVELFTNVYNRDLFKENNLTDLHEYYEQGIWTWDTFENEYLAKVQIDANSEIPYYAFQTDQPDYFQSVFYANDCSFVERLDDGTVVPSIGNAAFVEAITWGQHIIREYGDITLFDSDTYANEEYVRGEIFCGWLPSNQVITGNIAYEANFDSGVMPLPCGPNATYGEWSQIIQGCFGCFIPVTTSDMEGSAMIISELCEPLPGYEDPAIFYDMTFENQTDLEIFMKLSENCRYDYARVGDNKLGRSIAESFGKTLTKPDRSVTADIETYRRMMTTLAEDWIIPNYNMVHGEE